MQTKRVDRESFLVEAVRGKRALHIGCVDAGLLEDRLLTQTFLHTKLRGSAAELWGLDLDEEGVRRLESLGYSRLYVGSAETPPSGLPRNYFDVIVAGEVIEHVRNAGLMLDSAARLLTPVGLLVVTTPNALRFYNPLPVLLGMELVHPDHLSWYSPHTLRKAVEASPFCVEQLFVCNGLPLASLKSARNPLRWGMRLLYNVGISVLHPVLVRLFPYFADGLVLIGRPSPKGSP